MDATCPNCSAPLVEITISVTDGDMVMGSCSHCDRRSWRGPRNRVSIDHVLDGIHNDRERVRSRRSATKG